MTDLNSLETAENQAATGGTSTVEAFKAEGAKLRETNAELYADGEGSMQDKVAFVATLVDPSKSQPRTSNGASVPGFKVIGYRFKLLDNMEIPKADLKEGCKTLVDTEPIQMEQKAAGEEVDLNLVETAYLISQPQFAGKFTGEGVEVCLTAKKAKSRDELLPVLRKANGVIKDNYIEVASVVKDENGKKDVTLLPEFEKFKPIVIRTRGGKKAGTSKKKAESAANLAAAFFNLYNNTRRA